MAELKNGEFGVDMKEEKILWTDRKRHTIFALPISFTKLHTDRDEAHYPERLL